MPKLRKNMHAICVNCTGDLLSGFDLCIGIEPRHIDEADDLRSGHLTAITLHDATPEELSIGAVYPTTKQVLPKLRVFVTALDDLLNQP